MATNASEVLIPSEAPVIQDIMDKRNKIQKARNIFERQWIVNLAFLYGRQHFIAESKKITSGLEERILWEIKSEERKNKTKRSSNYILPLYRSLLARLLKMKSSIVIEPMTTSEKDKAAARVAQEVLEDFWQMANKSNPVLGRKYAGMLRVLFRMFSSLLSTGRGYLMPYFNDKTVAKTFLNKEIIEAPVGEVEVKVYTPFDVFVDRLGQHIIIQDVFPVDFIKQQYGIDIKKEDISITDPEQELLNMLEGQTEDVKIDDAVRVFQYFEVPTEKYPNGRYVITTKTKVISDDVIPPEYKNRIPVFEFNYLDLLMSAFPQSMVEQLISNQEDYNFTISRIYAYKKWFAGKLKVPKDCKLETKYDDEVGQIIYYKSGFGEPHFETPPNPPTFLMEDLLRIRRDMEDVSGIHDQALGRAPSNVRSGVGIENLDELDNDQLSPILVGLEQQLSFFAEVVLDIMQAKYVEPRIRTITGENLGSDVASFVGEQLKGSHRIKINMGSQFPMSKTERQQFIMLLADKGYIDRSKALELMEFGDLAGIYVSIDENAQKQEINEMLKGVEVVPNQYEYHPTHLKIIEDFMKGEQFKKLPPEIQQLFMGHYQIHQQFLTAEMHAAGGVGSGIQAQGQPPQGGGNA